MEVIGLLIEKYEDEQVPELKNQIQCGKTRRRARPNPRSGSPRRSSPF